MVRLQKTGSAKQFLVNDYGNLVKIKQLNLLEVSVLYRIILANISKNRIRHVYH